MMFRCVIATLMIVLNTMPVVQNGCNFRIKMVALERRSFSDNGKRQQTLAVREQHSFCTMTSRRSSSRIKCKCSSSVTSKFAEEAADHKFVKSKN